MLHQFTNNFDKSKTDKKGYVDIENVIDGKDRKINGNHSLNPNLKFPV